MSFPGAESGRRGTGVKVDGANALYVAIITDSLLLSACVNANNIYMCLYFSREYVDGVNAYQTLLYLKRIIV